MMEKISKTGYYSIPRKFADQCDNIAEFFNLDNNGNCAVLLISAHDGKDVAVKVLELMKKSLISPDFTNLTEFSEIKHYLEKILISFENSYLNSLVKYAERRTTLANAASGDDTNIQDVMSSIEKIEQKLKCGCTLSLAIFLHDSLYVVNIGDNQIICLLDSDTDDHEFLLLTEEHNFYNGDEIRRIVKDCGLNTTALSSLYGKSYSKYHSRCLGHFEMKREYSNIDYFCGAKSSPLICHPQINNSFKLGSNLCHLLLVSSGLYYLVMELIYDRDKVAGEIANEFILTKNNCDEQLSSLTEIVKTVINKYLESYKKLFEENSMDESKYGHEELSLMSIRLSISDSASATQKLNELTAETNNKDTTNDSVYASLSRSLGSALTANALTSYVCFDDWHRAEKMLSESDLAEFDSLLSCFEEERSAIIEEDESMISRLSRGTTVNEELNQLDTDTNPVLFSLPVNDNNEN